MKAKINKITGVVIFTVSENRELILLLEFLNMDVHTMTVNNITTPINTDVAREFEVLVFWSCTTKSQLKDKALRCSDYITANL